MMTSSPSSSQESPRLPGLARSLGASAKEFKEGLEEGAEDEETVEEPDVS